MTNEQGALRELLEKAWDHGWDRSLYGDPGEDGTDGLDNSERDAFIRSLLAPTAKEGA